MKKLLKHFKNPKVFRTFLTIVGIGVVIAGLLYYEATRNRVFIDNSLVDAPITTIAPPTSGTLTEIDVYEGEKVNKGDAIGVVDGQTIHTDTDGIIIQANNQMGTSVNTQSTIAQLINVSNMRIAGTLDENKGLNDIHVGQVVSFSVDALPGKTFWGYVDEISPSAKQTQLAFSISSERPTQQFVVYARFDASKYPDIKNGMSAKMTVFTGTQQ
ncbi:MAG TPA: efflux RND transporter periplasmic adaptor subunit [Candidatus Saccharimonadales bacterium]|nr:efflux RND transporter periplasmic adaptor subunit [Candidatus Saccharimonadales bacterium]